MGVRPREVRVQRYGLLHEFDGLLDRFRRSHRQLRARQQVQVIRLEVRRRRRGQVDRFAARRGDDGVDDGAREFGLHGEDVGDFAVEAAGPDLLATAAVDESCVELQALSVTTHAAFEHGRHAEPLGHVLGVDVATLEAERGRTCDDLEARHASEPVEHLLGEAVGEVLLLGIATQIGEGQYGDRWILWRLRFAQVGLAHEQHGDRDQEHADNDHVGVMSDAPRGRARDAVGGLVAFDPVCPTSRNHASARRAGNLRPRR